MRRLRIDFEAAAARPRGLGWALLGASVALAAALVAGHRSTAAELAQLEDRAQALRDPATAAALPGELERARLVTQRLTLPWGALFHAVETAATPRVALLSLQPDADEGRVRITAETRDLAGAIDFARRLSETRELAGVHLAEHQVRADGAQPVIRFTIVAQIPGRSRS